MGLPEFGQHFKLTSSFEFQPLSHIGVYTVIQDTEWPSSCYNGNHKAFSLSSTPVGNTWAFVCSARDKFNV